MDLRVLPSPCREGTHCEDCQGERGVSFRASLRRAYPQTLDVDGACKFGVPRGFVGVKVWPATGAQSARARTPPLELPPKSAGPGDLVEWAAKYTGAAALAKLYTHITGEPCGCAERKEKLNAWWNAIKAKVRGS